MAAPNMASHWIQVHGGTGDVMNQRVTEGPDVLLDTTIDSNDIGGTTLDSDFTNNL